MKKVIFIILMVLSVKVLAGCTVDSQSNVSVKEVMQASITDDPDLTKATNLINQKKWDQAIELLLELTSQYPKSGESWFYLANAYHGKKNYKNAIEANEKAARISQKVRPSAYYNMACAYSLLGNKDGAQLSLDQAMENGFMDFDLLRTDPDIELLRKSNLIQLPIRHKYEKLRPEMAFKLSIT